MSKPSFEENHHQKSGQSFEEKHQKKNKTKR
jgi:hypothetical protein